MKTAVHFRSASWWSKRGCGLDGRSAQHSGAAGKFKERFPVFVKALFSKSSDDADYGRARISLLPHLALAASLLLVQREAGFQKIQGAQSIAMRRGTRLKFGRA